MTTCKNCAFELEGKFCPRCGQKAKTGRITIRHVFNEARQHFIHFDQGFLYTIRELITRPGHTIREYIEGKRVRHIKPVKFMFWSTAINFLVLHFFRLDQEIMQKIAAQQSAPHSKASMMSQKLGGFIFDHPSVLLFLMIPAIAFCSWLLFRRRGYNYAEHFVAGAFMMGEISLASIFTLPVSKFLNNISTSTLPMTFFAVGIWVTYFGWTYDQLFPSENRLWTGVKGGLAILLGYLLLILMIGVLTTVIIIFFKPQLQQWLAS